MASKQKELTTTLMEFYHKPVAQVSFELILSILAVIFFAMFAIRPTLITMSDLIKEIEDKEKLDQQLGQKIAALSTVQTQFLELQEELLVLEEAIPHSPNLIEAVKIIEKTASEHQLLLTSFTVSEIPPENTDLLDVTKAERMSISASVGLTGEYTSIRQFVESLMQTRRSFIIDTISFTTNSERGQKKLRATITISIPYFGVKPKSTAKTPGAATTESNL